MACTLDCGIASASLKLKDDHTEAIINKKFSTDLKWESKNVSIETDQHWVDTGNLWVLLTLKNHKDNRYHNVLPKRLNEEGQLRDENSPN